MADQRPVYPCDGTQTVLFVGVKNHVELAVVLQWPTDSQANNSLHDQCLFPGHKRTTTHLRLRYHHIRALMLRTSPETTTQAHLMFVTINSAKIQQGCSMPMDRSSHP